MKISIHKVCSFSMVFQKLAASIDYDFYGMIWQQVSLKWNTVVEAMQLFPSINVTQTNVFESCPCRETAYIPSALAFHFLIISTESRLAEGWIARKSSLYKISSEKRTWEDSRESCQNMGADLVIVNDLDEQVRWLTCWRCAIIIHWICYYN